MFTESWLRAVTVLSAAYILFFESSEQLCGGEMVSPALSGFQSMVFWGSVPLLLGRTWALVVLSWLCGAKLAAENERDSHLLVSDSVAPQTVALQAPLSMEFSKQEYWSGLPFPSLGDLPHPGIKPRSPALQMDSLPSYSLYLVLFFHVTWHLLHYFSCLSYIFFIVHLLPLECKLHCVLNCWYVPRIWNTIQGIVGLP